MFISCKSKLICSISRVLLGSLRFMSPHHVEKHCRFGHGSFIIKWIAVISCVRGCYINIPNLILNHLLFSSLKTLAFRHEMKYFQNPLSHLTSYLFHHYKLIQHSSVQPVLSCPGFKWDWRVLGYTPSRCPVHHNAVTSLKESHMQENSDWLTDQRQDCCYKLQPDAVNG